MANRSACCRLVGPGRDPARRVPRLADAGHGGAQLPRRGGQAWAGLHNYQFLVSDGDVRVALRNNVAWLIVLATVPVVIGLAVATLADRVRHERVAKAVVVAPIAISFVAGAIIWQAMFEYQPSNRPQVSTLNAVLAAAPGVDPVAWLIDTRTNNAASSRLACG